MDLELDGNAALITASSSGLGKGTARAFCVEGADVTICGRDEERLARAAADIEAAGSGAVNPIATDLTNPKEVRALVKAHLEEYGQMDHLVTSAGGPPPGAFLDLEERDWYQAFDLLVMSAVWTLSAAHPHLKASDNGTVVAISSTSTKEPIEGLVLSNAVRRSVNGLVKTLATEWGPDIRLNTVLPGTHGTPRITDIFEDRVESGQAESIADARDQMAASKPLERIGDPDTFGEVVAFLSSPRAAFMTGAEIPIDGGGLES